MQDVNVVVVFCSRDEFIERLALAAAVGAVQGRANIRLRRLPDSTGEPDVEYVAPRDSDAEWADAIIAGLPAEPGEFATGLKSYFSFLEILRDRGKLASKTGALFTQGPGTESLHAAMERAGLITMPTIPDADALAVARSQGRRVAEMARSLRAASHKVEL